MNKEVKAMEYEELERGLKAMQIVYKSERSSEGVWYSWPEFAPGLWGSGQDRAESIDDMLKVWRESVALSAQGEPDAPERMPYYLKVLVSSDEELKACLSGQSCEGS